MLVTDRNVGGDAVKAIVVGYQTGIIIFKGLAQRSGAGDRHTHSRVFPFAEQDELPVGMRQAGIYLPLVPYIGADQQDESDTGGQAEHIDGGVKTTAADASCSCLIVVPYHGRRFV